jgi:hypothetical protein
MVYPLRVLNFWSLLKQKVFFVKVIKYSEFNSVLNGIIQKMFCYNV